MLLPPPPAPAATGGMTVDKLLVPKVPKLKGITTIAKFVSRRQAVLAALPAAPEAVLLAVLN